MAAKFLETRDIALDLLAPFPGNARRGDVKAIERSVDEFGQYRSLVVRKTEDGALIILAGNHTYQALTNKGYKMARCELIACDDTTAAKINLADNKLPELGNGYDDQLLAELLASLDGDLTGTGYDPQDLDILANLLTAPDLDALAAELGEPSDDDTWPSVTIRAPHPVIAAWNEHVSVAGGNAAEAFADLLNVTV